MLYMGQTALKRIQLIQLCLGNLAPKTFDPGSQCQDNGGVQLLVRLLMPLPSQYLSLCRPVMRKSVYLQAPVSQRSIKLVLAYCFFGFSLKS